MKALITGASSGIGREIARLLSGEQISDAARRNAEELLEAARQEG